MGERGLPTLLLEGAEGYAKPDSPVAYAAEAFGNDKDLVKVNPC